MEIQAFLSNGKLQVTYGDIVVLKNLSVVIDVVRSGLVAYQATAVAHNGEQLVITLEREQPKAFGPETVRSFLTLQPCGNTLAVCLDLQTDVMSNCFNYTFRAGDAAYIYFEPAEEIKGLTFTHRESPYWDDVRFGADFSALSNVTENVFYQTAQHHVHIMPLANEQMTAQCFPKGVRVQLSRADVFSLNAPVFVLSVGKTPYEAIQNTIETSKAQGWLTVELKRNKTFPKRLDGFGWCTWNACYHDVTAEIIYAKLEELKAKNIRLKWLLIDDGWSLYEPMKGLLDFKEDRTKFPEGLKGCIERVKKEYGVQYVGVWHAFTGYWGGISKAGVLYQEHRDLLQELPNGWVLPAFDAERAFRFWDTWHSYLAAQGVDFVKVDNQASFSPKFDGLLQNAAGLRIQHEALEQSVEKHFDGAMINCMGSIMESNFSRPRSAVNRNSDDYYPTRDHSFVHHIRQNAYVAPVQQWFSFCDYDMFWTEHETAEVSAVLRAISGGPVYTSEEVDRTSAQVVSHMADENGNIFRFDAAAVPTLDCFYQDCSAQQKPLKLFNRKGDNLVLAAFNLSRDSVVSGSFCLSDIPDCGAEYVVHDYFNHRYFVLRGEEQIAISLAYNTCALYSLYPIQNGVATVGDTRFYAEAATGAVKTVAVEALTAEKNE